jgi:hypothetical protein
MTNENAFRPWKRLGVSEDDWRKMEDQILHEVNPGGVEGALAGPDYFGVTLDEQGNLKLVEFQENGFNPFRIIKALKGARTVPELGSALSRAVSSSRNFPTALKKRLVETGLIRSPARTPGRVLEVGEVKLPGVPKGATGTPVQTGKGLESISRPGRPRSTRGSRTSGLWIQ